MIKRGLLFPLCVFSLIFSHISFGKELILDTIYGECSVTDPFILDLLESSSMNRLKDIDQHGIYYFRKDSPTFNRYDHCVGVYYLLKRYHTSLIEQAAGLIHDISHTAFSHLSDVVYNYDDKELPYQDSIHYWYLNKINIHKITDKYNYTIDDLLFKNGDYLALEQALPDLCADRLEYNLHTGYAFNFITKEDISNILNDLSFEYGRWFFSTPSIAKKFASLSLYFTENFWGSDWNSVIYKLSASAIQRALNLKLISFEDIHFSTDKAILEKLLQHSDEALQSHLCKCFNYANHFSLGTRSHHNYSTFPKFRGINPWVKIDNQFFRLTSLDLDFALEYLRVKQAIKAGIYLNIDLSI